MDNQGFEEPNTIAYDRAKISDKTQQVSESINLSDGY